MAETPPDWAIERANALCGRGWTAAMTRDTFKATGNFGDVMVFARYISEHEQPPVDPDVEAVKRILLPYVLARIGTSDEERLAAAVAQYKKERGNA